MASGRWLIRPAPPAQCTLHSFASLSSSGSLRFSLAALLPGSKAGSTPLHMSQMGHTGVEVRCRNPFGKEGFPKTS